MGLENNIPEGWVETSIGKVTVVESGGTPSTKNSSYWGDEISWITPRDLSSFKDVFIEKGERSISIEGLENSSAKLLPKNTILFSSRAPIGYVVIAQNEITTNQGFKNLICDEVNSHFKYFYYLMKYKANFIERLSSGSTFSEASGTLIKSIELNLPPLPEQKAIASVLSAFDDKIELLQAQNKTLETMAQTIFKEWFGKYQIGDELPEGWRVGKLGDILETYLGGTPSKRKNEYWDNGSIPWINSGEVNNFRITRGTTLITKLGLEKSATKLLPKGTVVIAITGATLGQYSILEIESCFNQSVVGIVGNNKIKGSFIYFWIANNIRAIIRNATGGAQQHINKENVNSFEMIIPSDELLNKFQSIVEPMMDKISNNEFEIQSLAKTRDTLLPKLMSGQVRVNNTKQTVDA